MRREFDQPVHAAHQLRNHGLNRGHAVIRADAPRRGYGAVFHGSDARRKPQKFGVEFRHQRPDFLVIANDFVFHGASLGELFLRVTH